MRLLALFLIFALITGCAGMDYRPGDLTRKALEYQAWYCATSEPAERAFRLGVLRVAGVPVPPSGVCTDILSLVPAPEAIDIDLEQAERDRERFSTR